MLKRFIGVKRQPKPDVESTEKMNIGNENNRDAAPIKPEAANRIVSTLDEEPLDFKTKMYKR